VLIIDGYNLLHAAANLLEESSDFTDMQLCRMIDEYLYRTKKKGCIVFDGVGPKDKTGFNNLYNLEVVFSGSSREADDVIEKSILKDTAPRNLTVVSGDNRIKTATNKRRATAADCIDFWTEVIKTLEKKKKKAVEPEGKFFGISAAETEYWLREFGFIK
jgi:predicted RNA-binding protein with PIN domain